ncbi:MAG: hypothetical protein NC339_03215, partial [Muribaculaceae bacterium]|nr:hypothetical protein [Muribaculaceae bacterium]
IPASWSELSDKQLRTVYQLIADDMSTDELKTLCLLNWSSTKVIGRQESGSYLLKKGNILFEVTPLTIAELLPHLDWLGATPPMPTRPVKLKHRPGITADFSEVPFETYIVVDNLYQGYLTTQSDDLLDELASVLYPGIKTPLAPWERIAVFYWAVSLKDFFSRKFPDFLQPIDTASGGNLLGSSAPSVEAAMNAQIRALTKGDVTKESDILALDTWRALTELNAQAKEYKELNAQINNK